MHDGGLLKRLKRIEITYELAQRSACDQLKSDQKNSSARCHADCKLFGHPLGPQYNLLPSLIVASSQVRVGMPLSLLSCCVSGLGPEGLRHKCTIPVVSPGTT
jgi:hypothetical protein